MYPTWRAEASRVAIVAQQLVPSQSALGVVQFDALEVVDDFLPGRASKPLRSRAAGG